MRLRLLVLLCGLMVPSVADVRAADFEREIRPLLQARCLSCHGPEKQRGGLRLDRKALALKGGDSGPAILAGKSGQSLLLAKVTTNVPTERMPPSGGPLTPAQIALLKTWIDQGATWPDDLVDQNRHWAFQPLKKSVISLNPGQNPIDSFIRARLTRDGLAANPEADRRTLIRRLALDLIGLPPTPDEISTFERDQHPQAYERLVERLLASPHFGERWARHWLDTVRFAESHGFEMNQPRPNAWHYRDYVIRAFNEDKPYDRFVKEQLAGDLLGEDAATGFLVAGPWDQVKSPDAVLTAQQRADELHDMVSAAGSAFLGLTIGCARCHTHKFDPIPQTDYYALKAVFAGVRHGDRPLRNRLEATGADAIAATPGGPPTATRRPAVQTGRNVDRFAPAEAKFVRFTISATNSAEPCIDELEIFSAEPTPRNVALTAKATSSGDYAGNPIHTLAHLNDGQYGNSRSWISNTAGRGWVTLELQTPTRIDRVLWSRDRTEPPTYRDRLATSYLIEVSLDGSAWRPVASSKDRGGSSGVVYAGTMGAPEQTVRLHRGDVTQPREKIEPGVLTEIGPRRSIVPNATEAQRRLGLAEWIVDKENPLTARVIVNRLWQYHFGAGLVDTPSDFGRNGTLPSHPELLDWLASELIDKNWSLKHVHRLIVTSATFRQSATGQPVGLAKDAQARLLWRMPPRRLEAETLRDTILAVSGQLDRTPGGPGFDLFEPNTNYVKVYTPRTKFGPETFRRMIYQAKPRMQLDDTFGAFDCPDGGQIAPKRSRSTTPLQALNLLNSPFLLQQSEAFAERVRREASEPTPQVNRAFLLALGREPTSEERDAATPLVREYGLAALCRALFNTNEFVFVR